MGKELDITGRKFGKLVAIRRVEDYISSGGLKVPQWLFQCDCGNTKVQKKHKVVNEKMKSCGCTRTYYEDRTIPNFNNTYYTYKKRAKKDNIKFDLSKEYFRFLTGENCYYCGKEPSNKRDSEAGIPYIYNGIDRIDSSKGYIADNTVTCCKQCNYAKLDYSQNEFLDMIKRIYENLKLGGS